MKKLLYIFGLSLLVLVSCKKDDEPYIGPELAVATSDFSIISSFTSTPDPVDFLLDSVEFAAQFNEHVNWTITIVGNSSGAVKRISGTSDQLDATNAVWGGSTDTLVLFRAETVTATLTVMGVTDTSWSTQFDVLGTKNYGLVWADFENALPTSFYPPSADAGDVMTMSIETFDTPQGTQVLLLEGTDVNSSYYIGNYGENRQPTPYNVGTSDPDELYFNVFIYGNGSGNQTKVEFQFTEDDNSNGINQWGLEDNYILTFEAADLAYDGWNLHSFKYSDITNQFTVGNGVQEPDKIMAIGILLASVPQGNSVSVRIDYPIFTVGEPLFGFQ